MKKIIMAFALLVIIHTNISAQATQDSVLTDSTQLISIADYNHFYDAIVSKLPTAQGIQIMRYWQSLINERIAEWDKKHPKKKK